MNKLKKQISLVIIAAFLLQETTWAHAGALCFLRPQPVEQRRRAIVRPVKNRPSHPKIQPNKEKLTPDSPYFGPREAAPIEAAYLRSTSFQGFTDILNKLRSRGLFTYRCKEGVIDKEGLRISRLAKKAVLGREYSFQTREGEALFLTRFLTGLEKPDYIKENIDTIRAFLVMPEEKFTRLCQLIFEIQSLLRPANILDRAEIKGTYLELLLEEAKAELGDGYKGTKRTHSDCRVAELDERTVEVFSEILTKEKAEEFASERGLQLTDADYALLDKVSKRKDMGKLAFNRERWLMRHLTEAADIFNRSVPVASKNNQGFYINYVLQALKQNMSLNTFKLEETPTEEYEKLGLRPKLQIGAYQVWYYLTAKIKEAPFDKVSINSLIGLLDYYTTQAHILRTHVSIAPKNRGVYHHPGKRGIEYCLPNMSEDNSGILIKRGHFIRPPHRKQTELGREISGLKQEIRIFERTIEKKYGEELRAKPKPIDIRQEVNEIMGLVNQLKGANIKIACGSSMKKIIDWLFFEKGAFSSKCDSSVVLAQALLVAVIKYADAPANELNKLLEKALQLLNDKRGIPQEYANQLSLDYVLKILKRDLNGILFSIRQPPKIESLADELTKELKPAKVRGQTGRRLQELIGYLFDGRIPPKGKRAFYKGLTDEFIRKAIFRGLRQRQFKDINSLVQNLKGLYIDLDMRGIDLDFANTDYEVLAQILDYLSSLLGEIETRKGLRRGSKQSIFYDQTLDFETASAPAVDIDLTQDPDGREKCLNTYFLQQLALAGAIIPAREFRTGCYKPLRLLASETQGNVKKGTSGFTSILQATGDLLAQAEGRDFTPLLFMDSGLYSGRTDLETARDFREATVKGFTKRGFKVVTMGTRPILDEYLQKAADWGWPAMDLVNGYQTRDIPKIKPQGHFYSWETARWAGVFIDPHQKDFSPFLIGRSNFRKRARNRYLRDNPFQLQLHNPNKRYSIDNVSLISRLSRLSSQDFQSMHELVSDLVRNMDDPDFIIQIKKSEFSMGENRISRSEFDESNIDVLLTAGILEEVDDEYVCIKEMPDDEEEMEQKILALRKKLWDYNRTSLTIMRVYGSIIVQSEISEFNQKLDKLKIKLRKMGDRSSQRLLKHIEKFTKTPENLKRYIYRLRRIVIVLEQAIKITEDMKKYNLVLSTPAAAGSYIRGGLIEAQGLWNPAIPKDVVVRNDINLRSGNLLFLIGPNSSGKTVLLKAIINAAARSAAGLPNYAGAVKSQDFKRVILLSPEPFFPGEERIDEIRFISFLKGQIMLCS